MFRGNGRIFLEEGVGTDPVLAVITDLGKMLLGVSDRLHMSGIFILFIDTSTSYSCHDDDKNSGNRCFILHLLCCVTHQGVPPCLGGEEATA